MFRFENENYLYGLILIPLFVLGYLLILYAAKKRWRQFGEETLLNRLMPLRSFSMQVVKISLLMVALACFIVALANPQVGSALEKGMRKGVDIMIAMDISNSMLAEDIQPNRLEASKIALSRFIDQLKGDRIGLVVFAGKSFVQLPITSDYAAAKMFVNYVSPKLMNEQGTDIASAIDLAAVSMLPEIKGENQDLSKLSQLNSKVILVVSDGEDHFPEAVEVAAQVRKLGITLHTIGIGDLRGAPIPDGRNNSFKKDLEGNTVITRLNEEVLKEIAAAGGGIYVHASNANMGFETILEKINSMNKVDLQEITFSRYDSKYQYPLVLGLIFLLLEVIWFSVKSRWRVLFLQESHNYFIAPQS
ncbi:MAG: VWA domain-containing protein [Lentimicrobiaceae bacterium]|nr:VWA domain-containing protein [Lentimicrobiaceae bacterium]